jgi:hypothetical protein
VKARIALVLLACTPAAFAGNVLVVGPLPTQLAEIQAAVDAAVDGDVILVKSGSYATFSVPNKELTITADAGQVVSVVGAIRVRNLAAGRTVVVSGLRADGLAVANNAVTGNGFFATNCAGSIRVQDCWLRGYVGAGSNLPCPMTARAGAELHGCADIAFLRCTLVGSELLDRYLAGSPGQSDDSRMGPGLTAEGSAIAFHESTVRGGFGGTWCNTGYPDGVDGGHGAVVHSTSLFASRSQFLGADGEDSNGAWVYAGWGGNGLMVYGFAPRLLECTLQGGDGGVNPSSGGFCAVCQGEDGVPYQGPAPQTLAGTARILAGSTVARESTALALTVTGPPGDLASLGIRFDTGFVWSAPQFGVQLLSPPPRQVLILGTIPASGVLTTSIDLPAIPSTDPGRTYHMQLITAGSTPVPHLGSPLSVVYSGSAYTRAEPSSRSSSTCTTFGLQHTGQSST